MPDFLLLLNDVPAHRKWDPATARQVADSYIEWLRGLAGSDVLVTGDKLTMDGGRVLDGEGEEITVLDGPYTESKEVLGGYVKVTAADYDAAVAIARTCPHLAHGGTVQVRQVLGTADDHIEEHSE